MIFKGIICSALVFACMSCKSLDTTTLHHTTQHYTTLHNSVDTVVVRDSVFVSERQKGDTVYLTRVEWRDRWRTRIERDTVVDVRIEKEVVQLPPERYVPPFYKRCTIALWVIIALVIGYWAIRRWR
jgi:hypothetical protein